MQKVSGIYKITCLANDKIYIGMSIDIHLRNKNRFRALRKNKHPMQRGLQIDFLKYGESNFILEIVEVCNNPYALRELEVKHINYFKTYNPKYGYNRLSDKLVENVSDRGKFWGSIYGIKTEG